MATPSVAGAGRLAPAAFEGTGQLAAKCPGCPHRKQRRAALARAFGSACFIGAGWNL